MKSDLNSHILEAINSAIESKILPSIRSVVESQNSAENLNLDLRSDGPHLSTYSESRPRWDLRSDGRHQEKVDKAAHNTRKGFPRLITTQNSHSIHHREDHEDSDQSDEENDYDKSELLPGYFIPNNQCKGVKSFNESKKHFVLSQYVFRKMLFAIMFLGKEN